MTSRTRIGLAVLLAAAMAMPIAVPASANHPGATVAKKKKKKTKPRCTLTASVMHGQGESTPSAEVRCTGKRGRPLSGANVRGHCSEPTTGARAASVINADDSAKTDNTGTATLDFLIDSYGPKTIAVTVTAKGYKTLKITKTFVVGPDEGKLDEA